MTTSPQISTAGISTPGFLYGTAWKEMETERLVRLALEAGFRGIDTANQRRHYFEAAVGAAVAGAITDGLVRREELFLQTKFTDRGGQDHRLPYDAAADPATQVRQSFASSLEHLQVNSIDSYLLHGPSQREGLARSDREVWRALEELHAAGRTRFIGISNVTLGQLQALAAHATTPPTFVQNRCYARQGWDREVRAFCRQHGITYQPFSLLTANERELRQPALARIAARLGKTVAQIVFRFALQAGMLPLTGTTDPRHMGEDLEVTSFELSAEEMEVVQRIGGG
jgi:diketogulonate reductase-like aldo/keto reductase